MLKNIAIPVRSPFSLAFQKKNATNTAMTESLIISRKTHRHHFHAGCMLAI